VQRDEVVFFVDRCLGAHTVPDALREAGAQVEVHGLTSFPMHQIRTSFGSSAREGGRSSARTRTFGDVPRNARP
jgi:hypothetical protein